MNHAATLAALSTIETAISALRAELGVDMQAAGSFESEERPIPIKQAAHEFGVAERTMRRYAESGGGVKVRGRWYIYAGRIFLPRLSANVR